MLTTEHATSFPSFSALSCWWFRVFAEAVHHVSVSINISHSSLVCGETWGTEPHFSWLYERVAVDNAVGRVSIDGTTLYVTKTPFCGHFTCTVSNKLGYSSATYTAGTGKDQFGKTFIAGLQIDWKIPTESCFNISLQKPTKSNISKSQFIKAKRIKISQYCVIIWSISSHWCYSK